MLVFRTLVLFFVFVLVSVLLASSRNEEDIFPDFLQVEFFAGETASFSA